MPDAPTIRAIAEALDPSTFAGLVLLLVVVAVGGATGAGWLLIWSLRRLIGTSERTAAALTETQRSIATEIKGLADRIAQNDRERLRDVQTIIDAIQRGRHHD